MSKYLNEDDIITQLRNADIEPPVDLLVQMGKMRRARAGDDKDSASKQSATILLNEFPLDEGGWLLCGGFQNFRMHTDWQKFSLEQGVKISQDDRDAMRKQQAEDRKRYDMQRKKDAEKAATLGAAAFKAADTSLAGDYLIKKGIDKPYGTARGEHGETLVRAMDISGKVFGNQCIYSHLESADTIKKLGRDKTFSKGLQKRGKFFASEALPSRGLVIIAEGVSNALTMKLAKPDLPVVAAFDAGNLPVVVEAIHKKSPRLKILIAADDDFMCRCRACSKQTEVEDSDGALVACKHCGEAHGKVNVGRNAAIKARNLVGAGAAVLMPRFDDRSRKVSDFNDMYMVEKQPLQAIASLVDEAIQAFAPTLGEQEQRHDSLDGGAAKQGEGELPVYSGLMDVYQACERYSLVYGFKDTLFDHQEHRLVPKSCVMDVIDEHAWREWKREPARKVVRDDAVGFDPSEKDKRILCNLWGGWPTTPSNVGSCEKIKALLEYLCNGDRKIYQWVLKWLAFPMQHPGAKMKTALVFHGPQGTGKNLFFENVVMQIYGRYGWIVDQSAVEDKFNDWASAKLFMVADEVVARSDLYHLKNKLKGLVTGDNIRINPKNVAAHNESNHVNLVFMSNEAMPLVMDKDDRRYTVVWTPPKLEADYYAEVGKEIAAGGVAAFHDFLLNLDLGDFNTHSKPIMTQAKEELIQLSKDSPDRFMEEWRDGDTKWNYQMCATADLFACYILWCYDEKERFSVAKNRFSNHISKLDGITLQRVNIMDDHGDRKTVRAVSVEGQEMPMGESIAGWRAKQIESFKREMGKNEGF